MIRTRFAVLTFIALALFSIFLAPSSIARILFPAAAVLAALYMLFKDRAAYISFVLCIAFISAFARRLIDYRLGFQDSNPVLLTPYLVAGISALLFFLHPRGFAQRTSRPIVLALVAVLYGTLVGLLRFSALQVAVPFLDLTAPLCFAYCIAQSKADYPRIRIYFSYTVVAATFVMGLYAVYQFFVLPAWDRSWLENVRINSFGIPEPFGVRAFSTMNAPVVFSLCISSLLLICLGVKGNLRFIAAAAGIAGLLLTLNRSAWLGFSVGLLILLTALSTLDRKRILTAVLALLLSMATAYTIPSIHTVLTERFNTFASPNQDASYNARVAGYADAFANLSKEPFGEGLGSAELEHNTASNDDSIGPHDSVFLLMLYSLGWFGTFCYLAGFLIVIRQSLARHIRKDRFLFSCAAALFALLVQSPLNDILGGALGILFWTLAMIISISSTNGPADERLRYESFL